VKRVCSVSGVCTISSPFTVMESFAETAQLYYGYDALTQCWFEGLKFVVYTAVVIYGWL